MIFIFAVAVAAILLDQATKLWAVWALGGQATETIKAVPGLLNFTYLENRGAAFGILQNARWFFLILTVVICAAGIIALLHFPKKHWTLKLASGLILGGAIGNMIDRVFLVHVRDFIQFAFYPQFPVFNIADSCVVVGCIFLAVYILFIHDKFVAPAGETKHGK